MEVWKHLETGNQILKELRYLRYVPGIIRGYIETQDLDPLLNMGEGLAWFSTGCSWLYLVG